MVQDKPNLEGSKYDWYDTIKRLMSFFVPGKSELPSRIHNPIQRLRQVDEAANFNPSEISEGRRIPTKIQNGKPTLSRATPILKRTDLANQKKIDYMRLRYVHCTNACDLKFAKKVQRNS